MAFVPVLAPQVFISFATGMMLAILPAYAGLRGGSGLYGVLLSALAAGALSLAAATGSGVAVAASFLPQATRATQASIRPSHVDVLD